MLINDTRVDRHHGCSRVVAAIGRLAADQGIRIIARAPAHADWRRDPHFAGQLDRCDLVIVNGEGSIHSGRPAAEPLLAAGAVARAKGKRSVLINCSWFDNDGRSDAGLHDFDIVSARESRSLEAMRRVRPDCRLVPDLSLYGAAPEPRERSGVGFGDSVVASTALALEAARKRLGGTFVPIRYGEPGLTGAAKLARSCLSRASLVSASALAGSLSLAMGHLRSQTRDSGEHLARLAGLELLVTGRFHGVTLALRAETPVLAVESNTGKIGALLADAGLAAGRVTTVERIDRAALTQAAEWRGDELARVRNYVGLAQSAAEQLFADMRSLP